jgi:hypothetical protein
MHQPLTRPTGCLGNRIASTQHRSFTGRQQELDLFREAIEADFPPFSILAIHGPGGTGKSTLIGEYARIAIEHGWRATVLDGRDLPSSPHDVASLIGEPESRLALFIDTHELIEHLDGWLREAMLPQLPGDSLVVIAGRNPLGIEWTGHTGWRDLIRTVPLRNLDPDESRAYLLGRAIPERMIEPAISSTYGHPLALSLVADSVLQGSEDFAPLQDPDLVRSLLRQFIEQEPSALHRQALEIAAHSRVTTESLLASAFGDDQAHALFSWLEGLSFVERNQEGLFPHDLVRDAIEADLRWRHPQRFEDVHRIVHRHFVQRIRETTGSVRQQHLRSLLFLHRHNPAWQPYHGNDGYGHNFIVPATNEDWPTILDMVRRHEGDASARIAEYWLERAPQDFHLVRNQHDAVTGLIARISLREVTEADSQADPMMAFLVEEANRHAPVMPGDTIGVMRFIMGNETYRNPSTPFSMSVMGANMVYTDPTLILSTMVVPDPEYWDQLFRYVNHYRVANVAVPIGDRVYALYAHDWRRETVAQFDEVLTRRESSVDPYLESPAAMPQEIVLSRPEFDNAVRQALKTSLTPARVEQNPLLRSRLVMHAPGNAAPAERLCGLLREAAESLRSNAKTVRYYQALHRTYLDPAPSQERAAEDLDLPFSSYRRYLTTGLGMVTDYLWHREMQAGLAPWAQSSTSGSS